MTGAHYYKKNSQTKHVLKASLLYYVYRLMQTRETETENSAERPWE